MWLSLVILTTLAANAQQTLERTTMENAIQHKIKIIIGDTTLIATLADSPTAKDFISLLPLDLKLEDYGGIEKISYLPRKLTEQQAPAGFDPSPGDITYYAPWGNLAIFYRDFGYAAGLINLGKIEGDFSELHRTASPGVRIELHH
ncbi:MAG: cyclophilin [Calditrichaeota bacterium]|nr:cyclophilin [Calditrichota bacterium]